MRKSTKRASLDKLAAEQGLCIVEVTGYLVKSIQPGRFDEGAVVKNLDEADLYLRCKQGGEL
jgi:hypothetical protein